MTVTQSCATDVGAGANRQDCVWIRYHLGNATTVGNLAIGWHQGDVRASRFDIQTSTDVLGRRVQRQ